MIAGVGSLFRSGNQYAFLFRYDPVAGRFLYLREAEFPSDPNTLLEDEAGDYLITGARLDLPAPDFLRAYTQRLARSTGAPLGDGLLMDLDGDERIFDAIPHPAGGYLVTGQAVRGGGAGSVRTIVSHMNLAGELSNTVMGFAAPERNARVFGYDVEVVGETSYVLQWGDLDTLTGSFRTAPFLSAFDQDNQVLWTQRLDLTDYDGEVGIELEPHQDGLLIYGYTLGKERDIFLIHTDLRGKVRWARSYMFPGRVLLYVRANQQLLATPSGIAVAATYVFNGGRSHEGLLLQLSPTGQALSQCVTVRRLDVQLSSPAGSWTPVTFVRETFPVAFPASPHQGSASLQLDLSDDCDIRCEDCTRQSFTTVTVCPGDSVRVHGQWQREAGIYRDTLPSPGEACDSVATTELVLDQGPVASYTQVQSCGLPTTEVRIAVTGGTRPYTYTWSDPVASGNRPILPAGDYTVTITDSLGCVPVVLPISVVLAQDSFVLRLSPPTCYGASNGSIALVPAGSGRLRLVSDSLATPDSLTNLPAGNYQFIVQTAAGCEVFRDLQVPEGPLLRVDLAGPTTVPAGTAVSYTTALVSTSPIVSYQWSPADRLHCATCPSTSATFFTDTLLAVTVVDSRGCTASDSLGVIVLPAAPHIYIPSAFSPNGDGQNDRWVAGLGPQVASIECWQVYDRWGSMLWAYDPATAQTWTGGDAGAGMYLYTIRLRLITGEVIERTGTITLVR